MTYNYDNSDPTNIVLDIVLTLTNLNISTWTSTTAGTGVYIGVGINATSSSSADIIRCDYIFKNSSSDAFSCSSYDY